MKKTKYNLKITKYNNKYIKNKKLLFLLPRVNGIHFY